MAALLAFAGTDDSSPERVFPMAPGGIRYQTFVPPSYKSDYLLSMDFQTTPVRKPDAIGGYGSWVDDLFGDAGTAATDAVTTNLVAQVPAITAAVVASPAYQSQVTKIKTEAIFGGLVLGALIVGGVWAVTK